MLFAELSTQSVSEKVWPSSVSSKCINSSGRVFRWANVHAQGNANRHRACVSFSVPSFKPNTKPLASVKPMNQMAQHQRQHQPQPIACSCRMCRQGQEQCQSQRPAESSPCASWDKARMPKAMPPTTFTRSLNGGMIGVLQSRLPPAGFPGDSSGADRTMGCRQWNHRSPCHCHPSTAHQHWQRCHPCQN